MTISFKSTHFLTAWIKQLVASSPRVRSPVLRRAIWEPILAQETPHAL